jgi:DNA polymerase-1
VTFREHGARDARISHMSLHADKIYLVDGSGYIFRAFYAVPPLTTKAGFPTNALFGFTRMLLKLLEDGRSPHVAVIFDAGAKTFRNDLYDQYKANRKECPPELKEQMPYFRTISRALGLPVFELPGFEADDIIGTLAKRLAEGEREVIIVSADKDLMQLVTDRITIWDTMRDKHSNRDGVKEKFGVGPEKVVEVLGLMGDDSDNVPGLSGCGPKTATQLIELYGDVATVVASAEAIKNDERIRNRKKLGETLALERDTVLLSRKLVEVSTDVAIVLPQEGREAVSALTATEEEILSSLTRKAPDAAQLALITEKLEFGSLLTSVASPVARKQSEGTRSTVIVYKDTFADFQRTVLAQERIGFDTETTSLNPREARLVGASFCFDAETTYYLPLTHDVALIPEGKEQVDYASCIAFLSQIMASTSREIIGQNLKYDLAVLAHAGVTWSCIFFDTMVAAYLLNPERGSFNLTVLAQEYLQEGVIEYEEVVGERASFAAVPIDEAARYATQDARLVWDIARVLRPLLEEQKLTSVFETVEMPLVPVLAAMEQAGILLDTALLQTMSGEVGKLLATLHEQICTMAGSTFNLNSPKQLSEVLFDKLGISTKGIKKTKTGISTDSSVLEKLSSEHPIANLLLEYRMLHKLQTTYIEALPLQVDPQTHRIHSKLHQTTTATGRLSSTDPNLQNIPITTPQGKKIRRAFIAPPGYSLISADYSQVELRVLAHLSGDEQLCQAFSEKIDIHKRTAREIFGLMDDAFVSPEQRRAGKTINFGVIYGMGAFRLAKELEISVPVAQRYIDSYFERYPKVKQYYATLEHDVVTKGHVTTFFGRKRYISGIDGSERDKGFILRAAMNAPIQGTAADLIKIAMVRVHNALQGLPARLILQIHDELLIEVRDDAQDEVCAIIKSVMEGVASFAVPLEVELGVGKNWDDAHG